MYKILVFYDKYNVEYDMSNYDMSPDLYEIYETIQVSWITGKLYL